MIEIDFLQFFGAARDEQLKVFTNGIFTHAHQFRNQAMRQVVAFQPEGFHPSLNQGNGMMVSLVVQGVNDFRCKFDPYGHVHHHTRLYKSVKPKPQLY